MRPRTQHRCSRTQCMERGIASLSLATSDLADLAGRYPYPGARGSQSMRVALGTCRQRASPLALDNQNRLSQALINPSPARSHLPQSQESQSLRNNARSRPLHSMVALLRASRDVAVLYAHLRPNGPRKGSCPAQAGDRATLALLLPSYSGRTVCYPVATSDTGTYCYPRAKPKTVKIIPLVVVGSNRTYQRLSFLPGFGENLLGRNAPVGSTGADWAGAREAVLT